ncbi:MAG: GTP cyclohydrolase [Bacteroides sp. SM23_62]|nr:MAG: GTP cyclohydrolase [Bacteroides sp. SM23_62]
MKLNGDSILKQANSLLADNHHNHLHVIDDEDYFTGIETPMRKDAFELDDEAKVDLIEEQFKRIMMVLGLDLNDDSLRNTPRRVAKMFVKEIFKGLDPGNKPEITLFENKYHYRDMLLEKDISVKSYCEHHFVPIVGRAHVAYISNGKVIGLSKINRIVDYFARRPQVQERLTIQIAEELKKILDTEDVAVFIESTHFCVTMRGVEDDHSSTITTSFHGDFKNDQRRNEFLNLIR